MFCPNCGFKNSEGVNYCARCGTLLLTEEEGQTTASYSLGDEEHEAQSLSELVLERATLVIRSGGGRAGETYALFTAERTTIGRHPDSDVFLDDVTVSRDHAVVIATDDDYLLTDRAASTAPTSIGGASDRTPSSTATTCRSVSTSSPSSRRERRAGTPVRHRRREAITIGAVVHRLRASSPTSPSASCATSRNRVSSRRGAPRAATGSSRAPRTTGGWCGCSRCSATNTCRSR